MPTELPSDQVIEGNRVWWEDGCWRCECAAWNRTGCCHTLKAAAVFTITQQLLSALKVDSRPRRRRRSIH